jgi:hypothetical protein
MMSNPFMGYIPYASIITDISRESSDFGAFSETIPFKQLVLSELIPFTTVNVNHETSKRLEYYLLQYVELGAVPSFFVSYNDTINLKETEYNVFYSIVFDDHLETILNTIDYIDQINLEITDRTIIDHQIISNNVYKVVYGDLTEVIVNYNDYSVSVEFESETYEIEAFDFIIE